MPLEKTQVLIVGAGPSGLIAAREAAQEGTKVLVLEEHAEIGQPCHCAGLLSLNGMKKLGLPVNESFVQNKFRGAIFFSPSGLSFKIERPMPVACAVDRVLLDKFLAHQAAKSGVEIRLRHRVHNVLLEETEVSVRSGENTFKAEIVIDAEGTSSMIVKTADLESLDFQSLLPGLQFDLIGVDVDPNYVEIHVGRKIAPGFFAWVIPLSEDSARVGLGCREANPRDLLNRFVEKRFEGQKYKCLAARSGMIVTSGPIKRTFGNRLLIVGDAAGQVKPTTGGGVVLGGICAAIAGKVAFEAVRCGRFEETFLSLYEKIWKEKLGREFKYMLLARKIFNALSDRAVDKIFEFIINESLQQIISKEGDMDFQSSIISELLRRKRIFKLLLPLLRLLRFYQM